MDPLDSNPLSVNQTVDEALYSLPLQPVPPGFNQKVIASLPMQATVKPHFELFSLFDLVLSLFASIMFALFLFLFSGQIIPQQMQPMLKWLLSVIEYPTIGIPILVGFILCFGFLILAARLVLNASHHLVHSPQ